MSEIKKKISTIQEDVRRDLDISRDEYALCSYVQYRQADNRQRRRGFCCDDKAEIADFVGISRQGLYKMLARLDAKKLIDIDQVDGAISVSTKFTDAENACQLSLHERVNKVDTECKQSLHETRFSVNKVTHIKEYDIREKEKEEIKEEDIVRFDDFSSGENGSLSAKAKSKKSPPGSAPPPIVFEVVDFLNKTTGSEFRPNSKSTSDPINARLKEGFTEADLKLVVEHKNLQWGADPKMFEYLRPKTLFGLEKFESYLQAAKRWEQSGKPSLTNTQKNGAYKQPIGEDRSTSGAFS